MKGDRTIYGFQDDDLPADVTIAFTPDVAANDDGRAHAKSLKDGHQDVDIEDVAGPADAALSTLLDQSLKVAEGTGDVALDMPLTILDTKPTSDTMAIIYSGDGGWRDIDSEVGGYLQGEGVPVVGVDSLRYFWTERLPTRPPRTWRRSSRPTVRNGMSRMSFWSAIPSAPTSFPPATIFCPRP